MRGVVILGSTGSVGTQALEVIAAHPEHFRVVGLAVGGSGIELMAEQAVHHRAEIVAVGDPSAENALRRAIAERLRRENRTAPAPHVIAGPDAAARLASGDDLPGSVGPADIVLNAITGSVGLTSTLAGLRGGRTVALANKESLVAGGPLVRAALDATPSGDELGWLRSYPGSTRPKLVPVDSEHTALLQCLRAGHRDELRRLILTASGGPFRGYGPEQLRSVTLEQAMAHPTWQMGPVITLNSATLVNKGLELIEAHELYDVPYEQIDVAVHPESMVHSAAEFCDGSTIAQVSNPDMRLTISLALSWPRRLPVPTGSEVVWDWRAERPSARAWRFEPLNETVFPAVELARAAGKAGGCMPAIYNAANEECVAAFRVGGLGFSDIVPIVSDTLAAHPGFDEPRVAPDVVAAEHWAREQASALIRRHANVVSSTE